MAAKLLVPYRRDEAPGTGMGQSSGVISAPISPISEPDRCEILHQEGAAFGVEGGDHAPGS